ncbi:hypothetical protein [Janthinobacterium sp.]|uniref:hypothetical protein n=1 Tax=Janthinobacterium sp. TaxID=1871054 RepID=UPI0026102E2D|nr:hypothetical protein [Janthinobacterium sp.]
MKISKIPLSKRLLYKSIIVSLGTCVIFYLFHLANKNLMTRYFYVVFCLTVISNTIYLSKRKRKDLLAIAEGGVRSLAIARMKFYAEVAAAFSLMAFFGPYYLTGLEFDKIAIKEQDTYLLSANTIIQKNMTPEYCSKAIYRTAQCERVQNIMTSLFQAVYDGIGEKAYTEIDNIIRELDSFELQDGSLEQNTLNEAITKLKVLDLRDWWMTRIFAALPLFASLFASAAVSSKVAVAWVEWTVRKTEQQTKQQEIMVKEQLEHIRLMEEAARKEQLNF